MCSAGLFCCSLVREGQWRSDGVTFIASYPWRIGRLLRPISASISSSAALSVTPRVSRHPYRYLAHSEVRCKSQVLRCVLFCTHDIEQASTMSRQTVDQVHHTVPGIAINRGWYVHSRALRMFVARTSSPLTWHIHKHDASWKPLPILAYGDKPISLRTLVP